MTAPSGVTTYAYTDLNQFAKVTAPNGDETTYTYDAVSNLIRTDRPNGTVQTYAYDDLNRLTYLENKDSTDTVIASYRYTYDAVGNKTSVEELGGRTVEYTYDELYRLVEEKITDPVDGNRTIAYTFDAVGNRLTQDDSVEGLTTYNYDDNDRLLSETTNGITTTYAYDDNGNLISETHPDKQVTYTWSDENRLVGAEITTATGTQVIEYAYDADGIRVAKTVDGDETRYLIDANRQYAQVLEEYDATAGTEVAYVYGNELISQTRGTENDFYLYDGHSGVRQLTDEMGGVTDTYRYDAYGNVLKQVGDTENSYLYRGEQTDSETGLQYLRARYNDFETGRLISVDPFEGMTDVPMSRHRYLYGYNNPLMYIDPSGEIALSAATNVLSVSSILGGIVAAISAGYIAQTYAAYTAPRDIEWSGSILISSLPEQLPFQLPLLPAGVSLNNVSGGFLTAQTSTYASVWLIVGANVGYSNRGPAFRFPGMSGISRITSPSIVGAGPQTFFGEFTGAGAIGSGATSGVFTVGFGRGAYGNVDLNSALAGGGGVVGFSVPTFWSTGSENGGPNLPSPR